MTEALVAVKGVHIGPETLLPPSQTLGWEAIRWAGEYLQQPDGPYAGQPWEFTREQKIWLVNWYAIDEVGEFVYSRGGMLRRLKGWGKDPMGAAVSAIEFVGPCRFAGFDAKGNALSIPHPAAWIQTAAVSKEQTRNTMTLFPGMFSARAIDEYGIDLGKEIIYAEHGKKRIEAVTSSPRALEGGRPTFVLKNETHHWLANNEGLAMAAVIARNLDKSRDGSARSLAISNAHNPGEGSDAEADWDAYLDAAAGKQRDYGFMYDSLEAPADTQITPIPTGTDGLTDAEIEEGLRTVTAEDRARADASLRAGITAARGDSSWLNLDRIVKSVYDPKTPVSQSRRFFLNQITATEDAWLTPQEYDRQVRDDDPLQPGDQVTMGCDGSKSDDDTVLSVCRVRDARVFKLKAWHPADEPTGEIPLERVDDEVQSAFGQYDVVGFYSDRNHFTAYNAKWEHEFGERLCVRAGQFRPIEWDMSNSKSSALAAQAYHDAIIEGMVTFQADTELAQYHYNAHRRPTMFDGAVTFGKETAFSGRKVDGVASAMLAWKCRQDYMALPENRKRQETTIVGGFFA
jgi:hypothetical protein